MTRPIRAALALAPALVLAACGGHPEDETPVPPTIDVAGVTQPYLAPAPATFSARVESSETARIATRMAGVLEALHADVGDAVREGQPIASLDDRDVRARIEAAQAQATLVERTFRRIEALASDGAASTQELDRAEAELAAARAALAEAEAQQAYAALTAPFDGVVTARMADEGALVSPGQAVVQVSSLADRKVVADLPVDLWEQVAPGTAVDIEDPTTGWSCTGVITRRSPALAEGSRRFRVELGLDDPEAAPLPGTVVRLRMEAGGTPTLWIPSDALVERGQLEGVFLHDAGTLRLRWIRTGLRQGGFVEVLAGLDEQSEIVRAPTVEMRDGATVQRVDRVTEEVAR